MAVIFGFQNNPRVELTQKKRRGRIVVRLIEELRFIKSDDLGFVVPEDFETDLASIPQFLWIIWPPLGRYAAAAILHDYLYTIHISDRKTADDIFLRALETLEVKMITRYAMYYSVRLFGGRGYKKDGRNGNGSN